MQFKQDFDFSAPIGILEAPKEIEVPIGKSPYARAAVVVRYFCTIILIQFLVTVFVCRYMLGRSDNLNFVI